MLSVTFTPADLPEDDFWRAVGAYLTPGYDAREIAIVYFPDAGEMHWLAGAGPFPGGDTVGGIQPHEGKVRYWIDPERIRDAWRLAAALSQVGVILELFPCAALEWEPSDAEGEIGALFTATMQKLRTKHDTALRRDVQGIGANPPIEGNEPARDDDASPVSARKAERQRKVKEYRQRGMLIKDIAMSLYAGESTIKADLKELGLSKPRPKT